VTATGPVPALIFARGGSKGVPGKNTRPLAGRPLIAHAIAAARAATSVSRIVVSTDDDAIADTARAWGAEVPFRRPPELSRDDSPEWLAWRHAIGELRRHGEGIDIFVSVPTTAPLRQPKDIDACVAKLMSSNADIVITVTPAARSPYFNMVTLDDAGMADLVIPRAVAVSRRQDAPPTFDMTTVCYAARADFVLAANGMFDGRVAAVLVPPERALDIDTELDLRIAECLLARAAAP
jgi:CMP-N-acetylneuraminic acid synthetase